MKFSVHFIKQALLDCSGRLLTKLFATTFAFLPYSVIIEARKIHFNLKLNDTSPIYGTKASHLTK